MSWTWQGRQLTKAVKDKTVTFTYDSEGIQTSKSVGSTTTKYLLNGTQILAQKTGSTTLSSFYDQQGNRVGMADGKNNFYYYIYNVQGDVIALADASTGKLAATYTYDAWGKIVKINNQAPEKVASTNIANLNPFRYRGYYYDTETKLYYLQSRYYDPEVGRFLNADRLVSTGQGVLGCNMVAYCGNNPVMGVDPTGQLFWDVLDWGMAALSCNDFINKPSIKTFGWLVMDTVSLLPGIPSLSYARRGAQMANAAADSWNLYRKTSSLGESSAALGRTFENWYYKANNIPKGGQQVVHGGKRFDAVANNTIIELKNYDWNKYSSYTSIANRFKKQANAYMGFVGQEVAGQEIKGVMFYFSSQPPEVVEKALHECGVQVDWVR